MGRAWSWRPGLKGFARWGELDGAVSNCRGGAHGGERRVGGDHACWHATCGDGALDAWSWKTRDQSVGRNEDSSVSAWG